jgi:hypothetical protein
VSACCFFQHSCLLRTHTRSRLLNQLCRRAFRNGLRRVRLGEEQDEHDDEEVAELQDLPVACWCHADKSAWVLGDPGVRREIWTGCLWTHMGYVTSYEGLVAQVC